jgi:hypothetical protein
MTSVGFPAGLVGVTIGIVYGRFEGANSMLCLWIGSIAYLDIQMGNWTFSADV